MIILTIDTSSNKEIRVVLKIGGKEKVMTQKIGTQKAQAPHRTGAGQAVLPLIDKVLKKKKIRLSDIKSIEVNTGPGSFTGLRVGVAVANALAFTLKIPVNGKKIGEFVEPSYDA